MDPRQARTWQRLSAAISERLRHAPLVEVSVSDLARDAGISRDTFYRHASSPADLLAKVLGEAFDAALTEFYTFDLPAREHFNRAERALFLHVDEHREQYLAAMNPGLVEPIRTMLTQRIEAGLVQFLLVKPEVAPAAAPSVRDPNRLYAAFSAAGTVGAVELWLRGDLGGTPEEVAGMVLDASAAWWLGNT